MRSKKLNPSDKKTGLSSQGDDEMNEIHEAYEKFVFRNFLKVLV